MVTVIDYSVRKKDGEKPYITLNLEGDIEMVQSSNTGRFYATVRRCVVSSSFDELTAQRMIGKQMPGSIVRVPCDGYDYTVPETGEVINLGYRWDYLPEGAMRMHQLKNKQASKPEVKEEEVVTEMT